jgi:hypothetical protein
LYLSGDTLLLSKQSAFSSQSLYLHGLPVSYQIDFVRFSFLNVLMPPGVGLALSQFNESEVTMHILAHTRIALWTVIMIAVTHAAHAETYSTDAVSQPGQACAQMPVEPMEDADFEFADYGAGLVFREYDLDGDGHADFMTARQIDAMSQSLPNTTGDSIQTPPLFYWIDLNSDSKYDQVWIDRGGQGRCDDIALYEGPVQGRALLPFYTELATR